MARAPKFEELVGKTLLVKEVQFDQMLVLDVTNGYFGLSNPMYLIEATGDEASLSVSKLELKALK